MKILIFYFMTLLTACNQGEQNNKTEESTVQEDKNHLGNETSPYLLQHADNPVNWYPWGEEALNRAKREDKPILVSIGYAACHWCHVMEHESFEDEETAKLMNDLFVCIKVDREERPDIDQVYMTFIHLTSGRGGWPLNVFLTPDQEPFFGGTYFPPEERYGRPSWKQILQSTSKFYQQEKESLNKNLDAVRQSFKQNLQENRGGEIPDSEDIESTARNLSSYYDSRFGGLGRAPKFPAVQPLTFFLRHYNNTYNDYYLDMVTHSLKSMAEGGIYDHLGGGFARYAVDDRWLVPHFEKMLYDNAQLVPLYLDTYLLTADEFYLKVVRETLDFVSRELMSSEGAFYSSLDADSEGEEGKYYIWDKEEIDNILGQQSPIFCDYYDVTTAGNFEGKNILHIQTTYESTANRFNLKIPELKKILNECRKELFAARAKRIRPGLDDKALTAWNALMLSAYARAYQVLREDKYKNIIINNINFIKTKLYKNGKLFRTFNKGKAQYDAYLDDYSFLIAALMDAYEALFDVNYLEWANELMKYTHDNFWDEQNYGYFYTSSKQEKLIYRLKDDSDQSIPSGNSVMALNNLRFYSLKEDAELIKRTEQILSKYTYQMTSNPYAYSSYLLALDFYHQKPKEILLVVPENVKAYKFYETVFKQYIPNKVVITVNKDKFSPLFSASLFEGRSSLENKATVYVCHNFACSLPVTTIEEFKHLLE